MNTKGKEIWFLLKPHRIQLLTILFVILSALVISNGAGEVHAGQNTEIRGSNVNSDLLVWYDFEDDFQTTGIVSDRSGHGYDAQVVGIVGKVPGVFQGQGILFSGYSQLQAKGNPAAGKNNISFALWFQTHDPGSNYKLASAAWWSWGPGSGWIIGTHSPEFWSDDTNGIVLSSNVNNDNHFIPDEWMFEVVTYDGIRIKEYTNAQLVNDWGTTGATIGQGRPMIIGAWPPFTAYNYVGAMDEFKIINHCLTEQEILAAFENKMERNYLPLIIR